jgi:hypothetical protein
MGTRSRAILACGLALSATVVAGCGSSQGLLSSHDHDQLSANLLAVSQAVSKGSCADTSDALTELETTIDGLPSQTNRALDRNLRQGATVLRHNALRQCHHKSPKPPPTTTTTTSTTSTAPATTSTTTSTPPSTSATTPPPTTQSTTTPPPSTSATTPPPTNPGPPTTTTSSNGGSGLPQGSQ